MGLIKFIEDLWDITHINFDKKIVLSDGIPDISEELKKKDFSFDTVKILMITDFSGFLDNETPVLAVSECNKKGLNIHLDIYGKGRNLKKIKKLINNSNCENISFKGYLQDFTSVYKDYDLFITSSYSFNAQMKTIEALRAGLPILHMDVKENGESEFIRGNGYLMIKDNVEEYKKTLEGFSRNKSQLITMGQNSRKLFEERYKKKANKTKITQVFRYAYPHAGGIETYIEYLNDILPNEKFEKEVLCCSNTETSSIHNEVKYTRARYFCEFASNNISFGFIWKLSKVNTDILHYHMPCIFAVIAHFLAKPKYKKMYITYHSDIVGYPILMKFFWGIYHKFMDKADKIFVHTPQHITSSDFLKPYANKCIVVPHCIDLNYKYDKEKVKKIKEKYKGRKILFSLGRHVKYKGFIYAIKAMKEVDNAVYLLGGKGTLTEDFEEYIKENNLSEKVILLGRIPDEDINNYYEACDIFLFPSIYKSENYGFAQLEAMRQAKPIINTWLNNGVNFVSVDKETGLTVEPENVEQLTNAINELINNDELRLQYGQNARKRVEELFDIEKIKEKYIKLYRGMNEY